jgi:hypothetical protein
MKMSEKKNQTFFQILSKKRRTEIEENSRVNIFVHDLKSIIQYSFDFYGQPQFFSKTSIILEPVS